MLLGLAAWRLTKWGESVVVVPQVQWVACRTTVTLPAMHMRRFPWTADMHPSRDREGAPGPAPANRNLDWSGVNTHRMKDTGADVDFFRLQIRVEADCPYLLSLPQVSLCHTWSRIRDAKLKDAKLLQITFSPNLYVPEVSPVAASARSLQVAVGRFPSVQATLPEVPAVFMMVVDILACDQLTCSC